MKSQNDVAGILTFTTASPDSFSLVTCAPSEHVKQTDATGGPASSVVLWQLLIMLHSIDPTKGDQTHMLPSQSLFLTNLLRHMHMSGPL